MASIIGSCTTCANPISSFTAGDGRRCGLRDGPIGSTGQRVNVEIAQRCAIDIHTENSLTRPCNSAVGFSEMQDDTVLSVGYRNSIHRNKLPGAYRPGRSRPDRAEAAECVAGWCALSVHRAGIMRAASCALPDVHFAGGPSRRRVRGPRDVCPNQPSPYIPLSFGALLHPHLQQTRWRDDPGTIPQPLLSPSQAWKEVAVQYPNKCSIPASVQPGSSGTVGWKHDQEGFRNENHSTACGRASARARSRPHGSWYSILLPVVPGGGLLHSE